MSDCIGYVAGSRVDAASMERVHGTELVVHDDRCAIGVIRSAAPTVHVEGARITIGMRTRAMPQMHGVEVRWTGHALEIAADDAEQRRVYWRRVSDDGGVLIATRLDLLRMPSDDVDLEAFAGQWCSTMNMSTGSLLRGVHRIPSRHHWRYDGRDVELTRCDVPTASCTPDEALRSALVDASSFDIVLGLSGGFDSRTLMAMLLDLGLTFRVHTYGTPDMPDVQRAMQVASAAGIPASFTDLSAVTWDIDAVLASMRRTAWQSEGTYPGAHAVVFDDAATRLGPRSMLVDGGYGALLRGGFGNALLMRHTAALRARDGAALAKALQKRDATFLRPEIRDQADRLLATSMQRALDDMPAFDVRDGRTWMDAFFLRWNPRGFVASPQAVYDARMASSMPFLARDVVVAAMSQSAAFRADGRWFRSMLRRHRSIATLPYVGKRGDVPWTVAGRPTLAALWSKLGLGRTYAPDAHAGIDRAIYRVVRPALRDLAATSVPAPFDLFDQGAVRDLAARTAEDGNVGDMQQLLDWLGVRLMADGA
jgi:hypothetical protein